MTATPGEALEAVMATIRRDAQCDVISGHQVGLMFNGADIRQAVEAYGRACRLEELQWLSSRWDVRQSIHARIAELEAEG